MAGGGGGEGAKPTLDTEGDTLILSGGGGVPPGVVWEYPVRKGPGIRNWVPPRKDLGQETGVSSDL